jgi:hypothetical protein
MQALELADRAEAFLAGINAFDDRLNARQVSIERDAGRYRDIFRKDDGPETGGTYWLYRPDGVVFYIGKADASLWTRITYHPDVAEWHGDPAAKFEGTTGEGWGFPRYKKLDSPRVGAATKGAILQGDFRVGWVAVAPSTVALLLEVYLQALSVAVDGDLPEFCDKLG